MTPPFLPGSPVGAWAAADVCLPNQTEPATLTAVAWTGWWNGNNYDAATGIASGRASAGPSGGRNLGPLHTVVAGNDPLHGPSTGGHCPISFVAGSAQALQSNTSGPDTISQGAFAVYAVVRTHPTAGAEALLRATRYASVGVPGPTASIPGFAESTSVLMTHIIVSDFGGGGDHMRNVSTYVGPAQGYIPDQVLLYESVFDHAITSTIGMLTARINDYAIGPTILGAITGTGTWGDPLAPLHDSSSGLIPWIHPDALSDNVGVGGHYAGTPNGNYDLYELLVTDSALDDTTRSNVRAALMTKYGIT